MASAVRGHGERARRRSVLRARLRPREPPSQARARPRRRVRDPRSVGRHPARGRGGARILLPRDAAPLAARAARRRRAALLPLRAGDAGQPPRGREPHQQRPPRRRPHHAALRGLDPPDDAPLRRAAARPRRPAQLSRREDQPASRRPLRCGLCGRLPGARGPPLARRHGAGAAGRRGDAVLRLPRRRRARPRDALRVRRRGRGLARDAGDRRGLPRARGGAGRRRERGDRRRPAAALRRRGARPRRGAPALARGAHARRAGGCAVRESRPAGDGGRLHAHRSAGARDVARRRSLRVRGHPVVRDRLRPGRAHHRTTAPRLRPRDRAWRPPGTRGAAGDDRGPGARRAARTDHPRGALRRDGGDGGGPLPALLRQHRRDAALLHAARRLRAGDRRRRPRARAVAARIGGGRVDGALGRSRR